MSLTAKQEEARQLLSGKQRHTCLVGGSRSGKTFILVRQTMIRALKAEGSRHAILRYRFNAVRAAVWLDTLPRVGKVCFPGVGIKSNRQDGFVELPNKSQIWMGGLDEKERVEKILGQEYSTLFFNECSQIPYQSVVIARTRLAQNIGGLALRAYYDLNPIGRGHWTNRLFGEKRDPLSLQPVKEPGEYARLFMNPRDNAANLPAGYIESELESLPERQRKRFLEGVYVDEVDGALWTLEGIEQSRCAPADVPEMARIVVAVDPSGTAGDEEGRKGKPGRSDAVGIVVAGLGVDGIGYVLEDGTCQLPPAGWGYRVVEAYHRHKANLVVAEQNFGGEMVRFVIEAADRNVPVRMVVASRGKALRAEPVSALYERSRVRHAGTFRELEDQMLSMSSAGYIGDRSPDRLDALVWAMTELMVGQGAPVYLPAEEKGIVVEPIRVPSHWPQVAVIDCDRGRFIGLWAAWDRHNDIVYVIHEYSVPLVALPVHAEAVRKRGPWIPALFDLEGRGRGKDEGMRIGERLIDLQVQLYECPLNQEGGVADVTSRLNSGRIKVFSTCKAWLGEFRQYRRDPKKDELVESGDYLMRATQMIASHGLKVAITENQAKSDADEPDWGDSTRSSVTGY